VDEIIDRNGHRSACDPCPCVRDLPVIWASWKFLHSGHTWGCTWRCCDARCGRHPVCSPSWTVWGSSASLWTYWYLINTH